MKNIIWENKSIVLGIIMFLMNYNSDENVIIYDDYYRQICKKLFDKIIFKKRGDGFCINIKNNIKKDLIINNIENLDTINNDTFYLLPWYNKDNPIIAFYYMNNKNIDINKIKMDINSFSKIDRFKPHYPTNYIDNLCNINIWDSETEYKVLYSYCERYKLSIESTYEYLSKILSNYSCSKDNIKYISIPINVPIKVPIEVPVEIPIPVPIPIKEKGKDINCDKYVNTLDLINRKMDIMNDLYDKK